MSTNDEIILYTNHACPWAHRAHIALSALDLPFKSEIIDLTVPRTADYLAINPRGLVPSISYKGEIYTESAVVSWLLADAYPGTLVKASNEDGGPQQRARVNFFVDTYFSKVQGPLLKLFAAKTADEQNGIVDAVAEQAAKELEPLLQDANPFFGGSQDLTIAEVLTGSFVLRLVKLARADVYPIRLTAVVSAKAPAFWKWAETVSEHPNVTNIWDEDRVIANTKARIEKARA